MEVHNELGPGFLESVYARALSRELDSRGIKHQREVPMSVQYKGEDLALAFRADIVCSNGILLELKAQSSIGRPEIAQVVNYLKATGGKIGVLLNFGSTSLHYQRIVHDARWRPIIPHGESVLESEEI